MAVMVVTSVPLGTFSVTDASKMPCMNVGLLSFTSIIFIWTLAVALLRGQIGEDLLKLCNSLFVMERRWMHRDNSDCNLYNLLGGRRNIKASVSTSIPKKVRQFEGPSSLETSKGTPRWWNVVISVDLSEWA